MATNPPDLTDPPAAPDPNDRVTFDARAFSLVGWLATFVGQMRSAMANVYANAQDAFANASAAVENAEDAAAMAANSAASAAAAAASAASAVNSPGTSATSATGLTISTGYKALTIQTGKALVIGQFVTISSSASPTNYMTGQITAYDSGSGNLTVSVTATGGSGAFSAWTVALAPAAIQAATAAEMQAGLVTDVRLMTPVGVAQAIASLGGGKLPFASRTSNTMLTAADLGKLIDLSGTFTQTFDSASNLGAGWYCYIRANGPAEVLGTELLPSTDIAAWTGADVVVNGGFTTDTNWTKGAGWTISSGVANASAASADLTATVAPLTARRLYRLTYTATVSAGSITPYVGNIAGTARTASGTYTEYFVANTTSLAFTGVGFTGTLDNASCEDLTANHGFASALEVGQDYQLSYTLANVGTNKALKVKIGSNGMGASRQAISYAKRFTAGSADTTVSLSAFFDGTVSTGGGLFAGKPIASISLKKIVSNGTITLDPAAGDTIDGLSGFAMYPREVRLIWSDGATLRSMVLVGYSKEYYASGTYTKPPGYSLHDAKIWTSGQGGSAVSTIQGGRGGSMIPFTLSERQFDGSTTVTIGAGGAEVTNGSPSAGGISSFGGLTFYASGTFGNMATSANNDPVGFESGAVGAATVATTTNKYAGGISSNSTSNYYGVNSVWGGGAGATGQTDQLAATKSIFAGNGGAASSGGNYNWGEAGFEPAGGGGACTANSGGISGAGARGELRIRGIV